MAQKLSYSRFPVLLSCQTDQKTFHDGQGKNAASSHPPRLLAVESTEEVSLEGSTLSQSLRLTP